MLKTKAKKNFHCLDGVAQTITKSVELGLLDINVHVSATLKRRKIAVEKERAESQIREKLMERIPVQWGKWISCDSGWDWILEDLEAKMSFLDFNYELHQVKEKYGTLRFYYVSKKTKKVVQELMDDAVSTAERLSAGTCEICGNSSVRSNPGRGISYDPTVETKYSPGGWLKTLCDSCAEPIGYQASKEEW